MSLILEALRKSEAERRLAQVPDLLTEPQAQAPVAVHKPNRVPLVAGIAVVVIAVAWFALRPSAPDATNDVAATPETEAATTDATPATSAPVPAAQAAPALRRPLVVAAPAPVPPPVATRPAPAAAAPSNVADVPDAPIKPLPASARAEAAPPPTVQPVAADSYLRVDDLGSAERKQLPPLKLSMHMWNEVPTQRFVIIDGTRLYIGDHLGPLAVTDILQDGVVLDWNGRTLKLPLR